jgi:antitoxin ChpS
MLTTRLRKIGGSVMLTVPKALLNILNLQVGSAVRMTVDRDRLVIEPVRRPHYSLSDLLAACDDAASPKSEDRDWLDDRPSGRELI